MDWYSQNFPQFLVIHTVKGFGIDNNTEVDIFLELFCFFYDPTDIDSYVGGVCNFLGSVSLQQKFEWMDGPVLQLSFI